MKTNAKTILYIYRSSKNNLLLTNKNRANLYYYSEEKFTAYSIYILLIKLKAFSLSHPNAIIKRFINSELVETKIKKYDKVLALSDWNYFFHNYKQLSFEF